MYYQYYTSHKISISILIFKRIKGGRDENVSTLQYHEKFINVSASVVSLFSSLDPPCKTIPSTEEEISTRFLKLYVPANVFFCFTTLAAVKFPRSSALKF